VVAFLRSEVVRHVAAPETHQQLRKISLLTQHELAARLSKPQSFIAKYEGGERRVDVVEFIAICRAMSADSVGILKKLAKLI
jgi:predicted transcriptional regulator